MSSESDRPYKRARTIALVLLFFLGLSAIPPAIIMIANPSGSPMGLPMDMLDATPFNDYLYPGIILGLFNGILSLVFALMVLRKHRLHSWMIVFQGVTLSIWLTAEILMGIFYPILTIPYYLVALTLLACGVRMRLSGTGLS